MIFKKYENIIIIYIFFPFPGWVIVSYEDWIYFVLIQYYINQNTINAWKSHMHYFQKFNDLFILFENSFCLQ